TLVVVEHDRDTILSADHLVEFGPAAGNLGGQITYEGSVTGIQSAKTVTGAYLSGKKKIAPKHSSFVQTQGEIVLSGCRHHNLKNITIEIPTNKLIGITGVSGSG